MQSAMKRREVEESRKRKVSGVIGITDRERRTLVHQPVGGPNQDKSKDLIVLEESNCFSSPRIKILWLLRGECRFLVRLEG